MYSQAIYRERFSIRITITLFFVNLLEFLSKKLEYRLIRSLVKTFDILTRLHKIEIAKQERITKNEAVSWLRSLREPLSRIDKTEATIRKIRDTELTESFTAYKKSLFRFEATLHKISTIDNPVIETPEYLLRGLSKRGLKTTLSNLR